jgi:peptide deformylase
MPVQTIIELGDPRLWEKSQAVGEPTSASVSELVHDLRDTLEDFRGKHGFGNGIAAPQIGVLKRVVYIDTGAGGFRGAMINPEMELGSGDRLEVWDSCFCFPGLMARVKRAPAVRVKYLDERGELRTLEARGELALLVQHEVDHLDGILAVEKQTSPRSLMTREEWERQGRPL